MENYLKLVTVYKILFFVHSHHHQFIHSPLETCFVRLKALYVSFSTFIKRGIAREAVKRSYTWKLSLTWGAYMFQMPVHAPQSLLRFGAEWPSNEAGKGQRRQFLSLSFFLRRHFQNASFSKKTYEKKSTTYRNVWSLLISGAKSSMCFLFLSALPSMNKLQLRKFSGQRVAILLRTVKD